MTSERMASMLEEMRAHAARRALMAGGTPDLAAWLRIEKHCAEALHEMKRRGLA
jgi:hypothetical protein